MSLRDRVGRIERKLGPPPGLVSAPGRAIRIVLGDVPHADAPRHPDGRLVTPREELRGARGRPGAPGRARAGDARTVPGLR
jgi:hypothetical protein